MSPPKSLKDINLRTIIDTIPAALFIVDQDARIIDMNHFGAQLTQNMQDISLHRLCGELLHCVHALNSAHGCGTTEHCPDCVIRNTIRDCCAGQHVVKRKADLLREEKNEVYRSVYLVSASPFQHEDQTLAILSLEDITELVLLRELVPICSHCKNIRSPDNKWETIEYYLSRKDGAQLTHSICPDCVQTLYPDLKFSNLGNSKA